MLITAASSSAEVRRYQNKILDTSGHQKYTVVVPIDSQVIISYISMFYSDFRSRWSICCVPSCQSQWTVILNNKKQRKKNNNATKYPKSCLHDMARTTTLLQPFNGLFSRTTWVSRYQKGKTNLDITGARNSEWQWHQLDHMQVCTSLQTDNHASTPPLSFLQARRPSCRPTNSVKALKAQRYG